LKTNKQIADALGKLADNPLVSQWTRDFSKSICEQIEKGKTLSVRQREIAMKIIDENSEEDLKAESNWHGEYLEKHKDTAEKVASYYINTNYYNGLARTILKGEIPNRRQYLKMVGNKYAKKVLSELEREPRFQPGELVIPNSKFSYGINQIDSSCESRYVTVPERRHIVEKGGMIISISKKIKSAAKGSKRYLVLPIGLNQTYYIEERFLKKMPKVKK
jgi:hypothetical protein